MLVGTCHVSEQSEEDVRRVLRALGPDIVMVELCLSRWRSLRRRLGGGDYDVALPETPDPLCTDFWARIVQHAGVSSMLTCSQCAQADAERGTVKRS